MARGATENLTDESGRSRHGGIKRFGEVGTACLPPIERRRCRRIAVGHAVFDLNQPRRCGDPTMPTIFAGVPLMW